MKNFILSEAGSNKMKNEESKEPTKDIDYIPMGELANYHQQIEEKYKNLKSDEIKVDPDSKALMAFNGYYALNIINAPGAFFTVDTNVLIKDESSNPIYDLALLVSMDGKTSTRIPFTGTFDGAHLIQASTVDGFGVDLTFAHTNGSDGTTASCSGTITLPNQSPVTVSGTTYNNPIPYSMYIGQYYETVPLYLKQDGMKEETPLLVMQIKENYQISYDYGTSDGKLQPVKAYIYNLNMYFFSFLKGNQSSRLIMGTAAAGGFACNNMIVNKSTNKLTSTRGLQTIPFPDLATFESGNISSCELAKYSGYYHIPSIAPRAFVSIQAQYVNVIGEDYVVMIGISMDGVTSKGYYFDDTMSFTEKTLAMPDQLINITFNRTFNAEQGSLVSIVGTIGNSPVAGYTLFNPVPLSGFGGIPMTNAEGIKLTVVSDNELIYQGTKIKTTMKNILYVPIMYILAYPSSNPTTVMSFGTDGLKGNTCIVTDNNGVYVVYAINNEAPS